MAPARLRFGTLFERPAKCLHAIRHTIDYGLARKRRTLSNGCQPYHAIHACSCSEMNETLCLTRVPCGELVDGGLFAAESTRAFASLLYL